MTQLGGVEVTATAKTAMRLSLHHLLAADRFAERIGELERENAGRGFDEFWEEIFQNALGVATLSVAALECHANELFFEHRAICPPLNSVAAEVVVEAIDRKSILEKYDAVLAIRQGRRLKKSCSRVQDADALIRLRNAVIHFRMEWFGEQKAHEKLSRQLRDKFETSSFLHESIFPRAWASHSFAVWAIKVVYAFVEHFSNEASLENVFCNYKEKFRAL